MLFQLYILSDVKHMAKKVQYNVHFRTDVSKQPVKISKKKQFNDIQMYNLQIHSHF